MPWPYLDFVIAVVREMIQGLANRAMKFCGSGVCVSVAANKITGIGASLCHDTYSADEGVEHDVRNVLCISGRIIGMSLATEIIDAFTAA